VVVEYSINTVKWGKNEENINCDNCARPTRGSCHATATGLVKMVEVPAGKATFAVTTTLSLNGYKTCPKKKRPLHLETSA